MKLEARYSKIRDAVFAAEEADAREHPQMYFGILMVLAVKDILELVGRR